MRITKNTFKENSCYLVRFLDHTHGSSEVVEVEIVAWCLAVKTNHVVFTAWRIDNEDKDMVSNNHEPISIVKSCILKKHSVQLPDWKRMKR
jgi:hypothetical protein